MKPIERLLGHYAEGMLSDGDLARRLVTEFTPDQVRSASVPAKVGQRYEEFLADWNSGATLFSSHTHYTKGTCTACDQPVVVENGSVRTHDWPPMCRQVCIGSKASPKVV